jgi:Eco57I restriction-modification methylase/TaqI-like C-terminal specificity domain
MGNPPYILLQDDFRDDQQLEYFRQAYEGASYKLDTYHLFIERGIRLCRRAGRVSLITPSNFLTNNHLDGLRKVILKRTQPEEIVVVQGGVFSGVSVDNAVFVLRAGQPATSPFPMTRAVAEAKGLQPSGESKVDPQRVLAEPHALFTSGVTTPGNALWDRLTPRFSKLGAFADVNFGKQLRDRSKFTRDVIEVTGRAVLRTHVACVTGKDVERYLLTWSKLACLHDTVAQSGGCWDEAKHEAKGKLLTRQIGQYPTFALDSVGYHCLNTIFMVTLREEAKIKPAFLLGVLNSKLLRALWVGRFYDQRTTFPKIKGTYLKELPIVLPDLAATTDRVRHDRLVGLVDKMLALMPKLRAARTDAEQQTLQNAVTATDQQIDALVYELYGLTEEEIKLVEGSV